MIMNKVLYLMVLILVFLTKPTLAGFYENKSEGWYWYDDPIIEEELESKNEHSIQPKTTEPPKIQSEQDIQKESPPPMSVVWIRENLEKYRDQAIDNPTAENVAAFQLIQRTMLDKASRFRIAASQYALANPMLDESLRRPSNPFGAKGIDKQVRENKKLLLSQLANKIGIIFFYRSDCHFCAQEVRIIKLLKQHYGFNTMAISIDGLPLPGNPFPNYKVDRGHAKKLEVDRVPALFLFKKGEAAVPISFGLILEDQIIERTIYVAKERGWIDDASSKSIDRVNNEVLIEANLLREDANIDFNDTNALVDYLSDYMKSRANR